MTQAFLLYYYNKLGELELNECSFLQYDVPGSRARVAVRWKVNSFNRISCALTHARYKFGSFKSTALSPK